MMKPVVTLLLAGLVLLAACAEPAPIDTAKRDANPDKYNRDRELCRAQVNDYMRTRRNVDESRRDVFTAPINNYGQQGLNTEMDAYSDTRRFDRTMESCMEARGWPQPQKAWWQKIGS